jgi:hypothetical protein
MVIVNIQSEMIEMGSSYNENVNNDSAGIKYILTKGEEWMEIDNVTTKELQRTLKVAKKKITAQDFNLRLGTTDFNTENINKFRYQCKNVKLRHIYFRLISKDFFTMEKMFKYKMVDSDKCKRCGEVETYKHLLWECREAKKIWHLFNEFLTDLNQSNERIQEYDNVFRVGNTGNVSKVKMKIIQGMIQVERPRCWTIERIKEIANEIKGIELYNTKSLKREREKVGILEVTK